MPRLRAPRVELVIVPRPVGGANIITINQAAAGCGYSINGTSFSIPQAGGSVSVSVSTGAGCDWNVTNLPLWLTATPLSGTGNGTVTLTATTNPFPGHRIVYPQGRFDPTKRRL